MRRVKFLSLAIMLALGACSDDTTPPKTDGPGGKKDVGTTPNPDVGVLPTTSILQSVMHKITMPKNDTEFTYDYGDGKPKNKLGAIAAVLLSMPSGMDFQTAIDENLKLGKLLMLLDVLGTSLTDDPKSVVRAYMGEDKDTDPANNFSGTTEFNIKTDSPKNLTLVGKITAGNLKAGPGSLLIVFPVQNASVQVNVNSAIIEAKVASTPTATFTDGKIFGLVPWKDVDERIIPAIATSLDASYKASTDQNFKNILKGMFDNKPADGTISADEVRQSSLLQLVLAPDVDVNKDGKLDAADAMSVGMGFAAVGAKFTAPQ